MVIKTKEFVITKWEYFKILTVKSLQRIWWFYVFLLVLMVLTRDPFNIVFILLLTIFIVLYNWYFTNSRDNKSFFSKRYFEIDDEYIIGHVEDGSEGKVKLSNVVKVVKEKKYLMVFISKINYYYIPLSAFYSPEDFDSLYSLLKTKIQESKKIK